MSIGSRKYKTHANATDSAILVPRRPHSEQLPVLGKGFIQAFDEALEIG